tara:strand:+ start:118 stop:570 length:453 start_codon:yes stop_codon:yes gene_type:complete
MKFRIFLLLLILFLPSCGYEPLYSSKGQNFTIGDININGEKRLINLFKSKTERLKNESDNIYDLEVNINKTKNTISKDKKGNPSIYSLTISVTIILKQDKKINKTKTFTQNTSYNNMENKFDLKRQEKNLETQLLDKIIENFIFFTQSIS